MTPLEKFLSRVENVRETASGQYVFRCPAHDDRKASGSAKELDDGMLLINDFAGCPTESILSSVGLTLADLYPERLGHHIKPASTRQRRRYGQAIDALRSLSHEALVVLVAAETLTAGVALADGDLERLADATDLIRQANEIAGKGANYV